MIRKVFGDKGERKDDTVGCRKQVRSLLKNQGYQQSLSENSNNNNAADDDSKKK